MVGTVLRISPMCNLYRIWWSFRPHPSPSMTTCQAAVSRVLQRDAPRLGFAQGSTSIRTIAQRTRISLFPKSLSNILRMAFPSYWPASDCAACDLRTEENLFVSAREAATFPKQARF